jgi:hypothetical protein
LQPSGFHSAPYSGGLRVKYLPVDRPTWLIFVVFISFSGQMVG